MEHFIVSAPRCETVVTHTFVGDDPHLASDAVFGVKSTLVARFERTGDDPATWRSPFDFVLVRKDR